MVTRSAADLAMEIANKTDFKIYRETEVFCEWKVCVDRANIFLALSLDCARDFGESCMSFFIRRSTVKINADCRKKIYEKIEKDCNMGSLGFRLAEVGRHDPKFWKPIGSEDPSQAMINMKGKIDEKMVDIRNVLNGCRNELMGK
jgi:hypothetical protein